MEHLPYTRKTLGLISSNIHTQTIKINYTGLSTRLLMLWILSHQVLRLCSVSVVTLSDSTYLQIIKTFVSDFKSFFPNSRTINPKSIARLETIQKWLGDAAHWEFCLDVNRNETQSHI